VDAGGRVVVPLRCPRGCRSVDVGLVLPTANDGGLTTVGNVRARGRVRPTIRLGRTAAARIRRKGSVRADLTLSYYNADGRNVRRTLRVTLRG
jgi:hypothetical protein